MKAIAYNITPQDKEQLVLANHKKHEITIIANSLSKETLVYASGKEALILFNEDPISAELIAGLGNIGIKYIATSSFGINHIDLLAAAKAGIKIANVPFPTGDELMAMQQVVKNLDNWGSGRCVGDACCCQKMCRVKSIEKEV